MNDNHERDQVGELVRLAGKGPVVAETSRHAIKSAVYEEWRRTTTIRRWKRRAFLSAASLVFAIGSILLAHQFLPGRSTPGPVGLVENMSGDVTALSGNSGPYLLARSTHVLENSRLISGESGRLLLRLVGGASIRMDTETTIVVHSASRFTLENGVAYFDSGKRGSHLVINTSVGTIQNEGTQFEVRMHEDTLRIRVREGSVMVRQNGSHSRAQAGTELFIDRSGISSILSISKFGSQWNWISEVPPVYHMEGRTLNELLIWVSRENGWSLQFNDARIQEASGTMILHGSISGLRPEEVPGAVLPVCGLSYKLDHGVLTILKSEQ